MAGFMNFLNEFLILFSFLSLFLKINKFSKNKCEISEKWILSMRKKMWFFYQKDFIFQKPVQMLPISLDNGDSTVISLNSTEVSYWPCNDKAFIETTKCWSCWRYFVDVVTFVSVTHVYVWGIGRWGDHGEEWERCCLWGKQRVQDYDGDVVSSPVESSLSLSVTRSRKFTSARVSSGD